jgi:hypothetical protein
MEINTENQVKNTKKLDNYQFGTRVETLDIEIKDTTGTEFYNNLSTKGRNMMDALQNLSETVLYCDDSYKKFKGKKDGFKRDISRLEGEIVSKQEIEDISTLYSELRVIDSLGITVEKYSELAPEAVRLSQYFR